MNKEEQEKLLKEAKEKYPIGTKFRSAFTGVIYTSKGGYYVYSGKGIRDGDNYGSPWFYCDGKWAEIIKLPKNYTVPLENLLLNLQIW